MLRHASHIEDGQPALVASKSFSGMFVESEHSGQRAPTRASSAVSMPWMIAGLLFLVTTASSIFMIHELRALRMAHHAQFTSMLTTMEVSGIVKAEFDSALARLEAQQAPLASQVRALQQTLEDQTQSHGRRLEETVRTANSGLSEHLTASLAKMYDKLNTLEKPPAPAPAPVSSPAPTHQPPVPPRHVAPSAPPPLDNGFVNVVIRYKPEGLPGNHAHVYWLGFGTDSEHLYADLPPGMEVHEKSRPGECWRVRDATTGNDLLPRYCASTAPDQTVEVTSQRDVTVDFHLPQTRGAATGRFSATVPSIELFEDATAVAPTEHSTPSRVGTIVRGGHLSVQTHAGARFTAREAGTQRVIATFEASSEAKQYATIGHGEQVTVEFAQARGATKALALFHVHGDGEEHLHAKLDARETLRVTTEVGEKWVLREQRTDKSVLTLRASTQPFSASRRASG